MHLDNHYAKRHLLKRTLKSFFGRQIQKTLEIFSCDKGIRQDGGLSLVLFPLFMNDLPQYFRDDHYPGLLYGYNSTRARIGC